MKRLYSSIFLSLALNTSLSASNNSGKIDLFERAPMPGKIMEINVKPGDFVQVGDVLFKMEAMKMESIIRASAPGVVGSFKFKEGDVVGWKDVIFDYEDPSLETVILAAAIGSNSNPPSDGGNSGGSGGNAGNSSRNRGRSNANLSQAYYFNGLERVYGEAPDYYDGFEWMYSPSTSIRSSFEVTVVQKNVVGGDEPLEISQTLDNSSFVSSDISDFNEIASFEAERVEENAVSVAQETITTTLTEMKPVQFQLADSAKWVEYPQFSSMQVGLSEKAQAFVKSAVSESPAFSLVSKLLNSDKKLDLHNVKAVSGNVSVSSSSGSSGEKSLSIQELPNEVIGRGQIPNQHTIQFVEDVRVEKSFFQTLTKYIYETLFDSTVGLLVSIMVMFYYMTSYLQSLAPLFVQRMSGLVRIRT